MNSRAAGCAEQRSSTTDSNQLASPCLYQHWRMGIENGISTPWGEWPETLQTDLKASFSH